MMGGAMLFTAAVVITISVYEKRKRHLPTRDPFHLLVYFPKNLSELKMIAEEKVFFLDICSPFL